MDFDNVSMRIWVDSPPVPVRSRCPTNSGVFATAGSWRSWGSRPWPLDYLDTLDEQDVKLLASRREAALCPQSERSRMTPTFRDQATRVHGAPGGLKDPPTPFNC